MKSSSRPLPRIFGGLFALALAFSLQITPALAADRPLNFLKPGAVDVVALLAAPPLAGSLEQQADMAAVVHARNTCSSNDLAVALEQDRGLTAFNLAPFIGDYFRAERLPKTAALFRHAQRDTSQFVAIAKTHWKRLRPSVVDTNLLIIQPDLDFSYPSGHSTAATILALILTDLMPEQAQPLLSASRDAGWHRVQLARHFPSDIQAGRVVAQALYRAMKINPTFQKEFAEAQEEIALARTPLVPALPPTAEPKTAVPVGQ